MIRLPTSLAILKKESLGYKTHRHYPNDSFFKIAKEVGNRIIIGTDAHESRSLLDMKTYHKARQHLENLGLSITEDITCLLYTSRCV